MEQLQLQQVQKQHQVQQVQMQMIVRPLIAMVRALQKAQVHYDDELI